MKKTLLSMIIALTLNTAYADIDKGFAAYKNKDYTAAFKEFKESADAGDARAQNYIGLMYRIGDGVPKNISESLKWYNLAVSQGNATAQYMLGNMYETGTDAPKNIILAYALYDLLASQDDKHRDELEPYLTPEQLAEAKEISMNWKVGTPFPTETKDMRELKVNAYRGDASAQYNLGLMYGEGVGFNQNDQESVKLITLAANKGLIQAQMNLGFTYQYGQGIPKNIEEAIKWFTLAASQGDVDAQYDLGVLYANGDDVSKNTILSYALFDLAANQGDDEAKENRNKLKPALTPDQLAEAQEISTNWKVNTPFPTETKY